MKHSIRIRHLLLAAALCFAAAGCDNEDEDTNALGGETNLDLTKVGNVFPISVTAESYVPAFNRLKDSVVITRNDGGIVTFRGIMTFDTAFTRALAAELDLDSLPSNLLHAVVAEYVNRYGALLDTTDKNAMTATADVRFRITSEGIQGFAYGKGDLNKPFTIVRYDANVGDAWDFTTDEGVKITRRVTYKSSVEDYQIGFWLIKVIKVEETREDPYIEKITFVANHKYGVVAALLKTKTGKELKAGIWPPTL